MARKPTNEGKAVTDKRPADRDDPEQSKRFLEAAREHGADETEKGADRAFRKVVTKVKPKAR